MNVRFFSFCPIVEGLELSDTAIQKKINRQNGIEDKFSDGRHLWMTKNCSKIDTINSAKYCQHFALLLIASNYGNS